MGPASSFISNRKLHPIVQVSKVFGGLAVGPPGGYPPFRCKNPHGGPHVEPLRSISRLWGPPPNPAGRGAGRFKSSLPHCLKAPLPQCPSASRTIRQPCRTPRPSLPRRLGRFDRASVLLVETPSSTCPGQMQLGSPREAGCVLSRPMGNPRNRRALCRHRSARGTGAAK